MAELRICNHTDLVIDFVAGIKHEHRIHPGEEIVIEIEDGDYMYIDQILTQDEREAKLSESIED